MKATLPIVACLSVGLISSGCLKTRAQMREKGEDQSERSAPSAPVPVQVKEVRQQDAYVVDELKTEITRLNGRIEDLERAQQQAAGDASKRDREAIKKLETRVVELEQAQVAMLEAIKKAEQAPPPATPADAAAQFDKGKRQYNAGDFDSAIESFSLYLKKPGKNQEEATYLRGEAYYALKQYKKAIVDYSKFPEKFTSSKRMPAALYRIGLCFDQLGMKEDSRGFYQKVIEDFPKSAEAKKARQKLKG